MEESRKRRRGTDEAEVEQSKDRTRNFVSNKAKALMKRSLKDGGFIAKRGFKKLISVDRIRVYTQVYNTITKRLLSNPWQTAP